MSSVLATHFSTPNQNTVSWRHLRPKNWHQLDLILTRHSGLPSVMITCSYQSADCDTDHSLLWSKMRLRAKTVHHTRKDGRPRIDINKIHDQGKVEEFVRTQGISSRFVQCRWPWKVGPLEVHSKKVTPTHTGGAGHKTNPRWTLVRPWIPLPLGRHLGEDSISAEILKCCKGTFITEQHEILCLCCKEGRVLQDLKDANINVTLYKSKGNRSDCNYYYSISLLSIVGKLSARVALKRLQVLAEKVCPGSQCRFQDNRSNIDMVMDISSRPSTWSAETASPKDWMST